MPVSLEVSTVGVNVGEAQCPRWAPISDGGGQRHTVTVY